MAPSVLQMLLMVLTGWLERREQEALAYLIEENRLLRRQHLRRTIAEYFEHYHPERNHQVLEHELIEGAAAVARVGSPTAAAWRAP